MQEAVVSAIKARLKALRHASGGSIDLAGVRDRVLDSLYKQQLAAEEQRSRRSAAAHAQERLAAQMAARIIGERIRADSAERQVVQNRRTGEKSVVDLSTDEEFEQRAGGRRGRSHSRSRTRISADLSRGRSQNRRTVEKSVVDLSTDEEFEQRAGGRRERSHSRSRTQRSPVSPYRGRTSRHSRKTQASTDSDSDESTRYANGEVDGHDTADRRYLSKLDRRSSRLRDLSQQSGLTAADGLPKKLPGSHSALTTGITMLSSRSGSNGDASTAASSRGSLYLSGPSTNFGHPRTPLFHNVEHVLHARR